MLAVKNEEIIREEYCKGNTRYLHSTCCNSKCERLGPSLSSLSGDGKAKKVAASGSVAIPIVF